MADRALSDSGGGSGGGGGGGGLELTQVLPSCEAVASRAQHVHISGHAVKSVAKDLAGVLASRAFSLAHWRKHELHPSEPEDRHVDFIFVMDALNFSFWTPEGTTYAVEHKGKQWTGYWSLVAALSRAIDEGTDICDPAVCAALSLEQVKHIFRSVSGTEVPMLRQRHEILTQIGRTLVKRFQGTFRTCVQEAAGSAQALVRLVTAHFPSFRDSSTYKGQQVLLLKRAQILVADLWGCYQGDGWGRFDDIDAITMFADYRVPQSLVHLGLLQYSDELTQRLREGALLPNGSEMEVEIRACSIWSVELLRQAVQEELRSRGEDGVHCNSVILDFYLWDLAKANSGSLAHIPVHHTRSVFY